MPSPISFLSPKGSAWLVYHRCFKGGGVKTSWAFVFNYEKGLTCFEAWQRAELAGNPPYCDVIAEQLEVFPSRVASVDTRALTEKAEIAFNRLRKLVR
jgi:hypothetical protein